MSIWKMPLLGTTEPRDALDCPDSGIADERT